MLRVSVAWLNSSIRVSACSRWPKKNGELAASAICGADQRLGGVPVRGEVLGRDLQVQLHARAGRLGGDGVAVGGDPLPRRALDVEVDVLAAGVEDRVVERRVAVVGADPLALEVLGHDRRQDADRHDVRAALLGRRGRGVERGPQLFLELDRRVARQRARGHVELDVVLRQLGLVAGVGDGLEDLGVGELGLVVVVDEVELDLQAGHRPVELEDALDSIRSNTSRFWRTFSRYCCRCSRV